ncbi:chromo domain-containing protein cec-1-like isoform X2 [Dendropsophus ebraccatus]|uniref:chromo domain-containing protein cec-1-like isoform X2 n=1 Tax=Dendropsophus ebraccatus TaxID=150705 RepID=UPI00383152D2
MADQKYFPDDIVASQYIKDLQMEGYFEDSDFDDDVEEEELVFSEEEDRSEEYTEEDILEWAWQQEVKKTPKMFSPDRFETDTWTPSLRTIMEEDTEEEEEELVFTPSEEDTEEEEEKIVATPRAEEEEEEEETAVETPRSSSRSSRRSIFSRLRALFCCGCTIRDE